MRRHNKALAGRTWTDVPKLYVENSIVSYLTARPSRNIITAARQELTRQWWNGQRANYDLYIS